MSGPITQGPFLTEGFNQNSQSNRIGHPSQNFSLNLILNCCVFRGLANCTASHWPKCAHWVRGNFDIRKNHLPSPSPVKGQTPTVKRGVELPLQLACPWPRSPARAAPWRRPCPHPRPRLPVSTSLWTSSTHKHRLMLSYGVSVSIFLLSPRCLALAHKTTRSFLGEPATESWNRAENKTGPGRRQCARLRDGVIGLSRTEHYSAASACNMVPG